MNLKQLEQDIEQIEAQHKAWYERLKAEHNAIHDSLHYFGYNTLDLERDLKRTYFKHLKDFNPRQAPFLIFTQ